MVAIYDAYSYVPGACGAGDSFGTLNWFEPVRTVAVSEQQPNMTTSTKVKTSTTAGTQLCAVGTLAGLAHNKLSLTRHYVRRRAGAVRRRAAVVEHQYRVGPRGSDF